MKALVVDDSVVMRRILMQVLNKVGYTEVDQAPDGKEAVVAATAFDYDVILMDWNMPNMTGIDAARAIRQKGKKTPIIMVTTEAEKTRVLEALKAGVNNYIIKPFEPDAAVTKIKEVLEKAKAAGS
jgi:two-component system chemotaxis response regulator CheY